MNKKLDYRRKNLIEARLRLGMTQQQLADKLGVDVSSVKRWERGGSDISSIHKYHLSTILGIEGSEIDSNISKWHEASNIYDPRIPLPPALFLGREQIMQTLKESILHHRESPVALYGLPGCGKTALAAVFAREVKDYFDGVLWAGLGIQPHHANILERWQRLLHAPTASFSDLRTVLHNRAFLIILDDVWTREDAIRFQLGGEQCTYLFTSRFPTLMFHLASVTFHVGELSEEVSIALLQQLVPTLDSTMITHLVQDTLGHLPLELLLAGKHLRYPASTHNTRRINEALLLLQDTRRRFEIGEVQSPVESHPSIPTDIPVSLKASIALSLTRLSKEARLLLKHLVQRFGSHPFIEAEAETQCKEWYSPQTLDELYDDGLIHPTDINAYSIHPTIVHYVSLFLNNSSER